MTRQITKSQHFDVLDCDPESSQRWIMRYWDGTVRKSSHRYDLIRDVDKTRVTVSAHAMWGSGCPFEVVSS